MRRGEILKLRWQDVDFMASLIIVRAFNTKTMRERQVQVFLHFRVLVGSLQGFRARMSARLSRRLDSKSRVRKDMTVRVRPPAFQPSNKSSMRVELPRIKNLFR
jgi:integrase